LPVLAPCLLGASPARVPLGRCLSLQLPSVKDYLASVALVAPFGVEPVSEAFVREGFGDPARLAHKMADARAAAPRHRSLCAKPAFKPAFWFTHHAAEWARLEKSFVATGEALCEAHDAGVLFRQVLGGPSGCRVTKSDIFSLPCKGPQRATGLLS